MFRGGADSGIGSAWRWRVHGLGAEVRRLCGGFGRGRLMRLSTGRGGGWQRGERGHGTGDEVGGGETEIDRFSCVFVSTA